MKKHRKLLKRLHGRLVEGIFLMGPCPFPNAFPANVVQQIKLGESSGNLSSTLRRIIEQLESYVQ
ncbi:MAG: hypothetical protein R3C56_28415 [Pirellulaceae bacterium]